MDLHRSPLQVDPAMAAEVDSKEAPQTLTPEAALQAELRVLTNAFGQARQQASDLFALHEYMTQVRMTPRLGAIINYPLVIDDLKSFEAEVLAGVPEKRSRFEMSERMVQLADDARSKHQKEQTDSKV